METSKVKKITMTLLAKENGMKNCNALENQTMCRILLIACATALAVAFAVALPQPARAAIVTPPPVPTNIEVPTGNTLFLVGHGVGTQNYICLPSGTGFKYVLFTPEATLFKPEDNTKQLITHFFSPNRNPTEGSGDEEGTIRVTWQDSRDTSTVWAKLNINLDGSPSSSTDPAFVDPEAVAWLLLKEVGAEDGPTGGDTLSNTTFIQRLSTSGGLAPSQDCASSADVGKQAFVPYEADYFFYKAD
jgi:hypothetical protein